MDFLQGFMNTPFRKAWAVLKEGEPLPKNPREAAQLGIESDEEAARKFQAVREETLKGSTGGGMFQCDQCGETFMGQGQYQQHVQQTGHQTTDTGGTNYGSVDFSRM